MKVSYILLLIMAASVLTTSCEKEVVLNSTQAPPRVVIDGLVTNRSFKQYVKVTMSAGFYDDGETPRVDDAMIQLKDDLGNVTDFFHNPNGDPDSVGYYMPPAGFAGVIGRTYTLTVQVKENVFEATDRMYPVTPIDSLTITIDQDEFEDPEEPGRFYEVLIYANEPQDTKDYYLFSFFRNDSVLLDSPTDIYFSDDIALGQEINGIAGPGYYALGETARVEAMSLTRSGFVFYNDLSILLNNDGGMFSPPPANCRNNLSGGALGFFQVSALESKEIVVE